MKIDKLLVSVLLLSVLLCFISCDNFLNQNPVNTTGATGVNYGGNSGGSGGSTTTTPTTNTTTTNSDMKLVAGGTFSMGSTSGENDETPVHNVIVSSFYMCDHEVTQAEFNQIMGTNPSSFSSNPVSGEVLSNRPVEQVSWYDAIAYCNKRSLAEGLTPCYSVSGVTDWASLSYSSIPTSSNSNWDNATCNWSANGYRLPTEAEWEYAARGGIYNGNNSYEYSGSSTIGNVAWYTGNSSNKTHEVKKMAANALGLYDMSGNVKEWCWDWYGSYDSSFQTNPRGASSGSYRVVRGGCWGFDASNCRVAFRYNYTPDHASSSLGFRVVRSTLEQTSGTAGGSANNDISIVKTSDGAYRFTQSSDGYWTSNNNGVNNSTAISTWSITASSSTTLSIYYDVSSESDRDKFTLIIDNTNVVTDVSGTVTNTVTRTLTSGSHSVTATYSKDGSTSSGSDQVRIRFGGNGSSTTTITPTTGMRLVTGGTFSMGGSYATPVHSVTLASFYMCDHEVTQAEFSEIMGTNPSYFSSNPASGEVQGNRPVEQVSWYDAIAYCNKRSLAEGKTPCYSVSGVTDWASLSYSSIPTSSNSNWDNATCNWSADGYRLPTEAEWEYAARGGTYNSSYTYSGSNTIGNVAWYYDNSSSKTHEVKKKTANALGLYDMSGNVWEWCWDWYGSYSSGSQSNPRGASSGSYRVLRGGCWYDYASC